jgi:hypothetical protein
MTTTAPATGNPHDDKSTLIGFIAVLFGCFATYVILQYAIANLDTLGLPDSIKKVRSYDIYLLVFVHVFLFFIGGVIAYQHPRLRFWLMLLAVGIFIYDFGGTFQARMGNVQQQNLTQAAQKDHAKILSNQAEASQSAARQLQQSAARQLANKHITGSAKTAAEAAQQANMGAKMVEQHAATIANIHPTEQDTWGEWTTQKMFAGALLVHLVNFAMWTLAGVMFGANHVHAATIEAPEPRNTAPSTFATRAAAAGVVGGAALGGAGMAHANQPPVVKYWGTISSEQQNDAFNREQQKEPTASKRKHRVLSNESSKQMDTGTDGNAAHRYRRVKAAIKSGALKPSIRAIQREEHTRHDIAAEYMNALEKEGVVVKDGRGWKAI